MKTHGILALILAFGLAQSIRESQAQPKNWDSDLSKMMDGLENEVGKSDGPPAPSTPTMPESPSSTQTVAPPAMPEPSGTTKKTENKTQPQSSANVLADLMKMKDNYLGTIANHGLTRWNSSSMPVKVFIEQSSKASGFRPQFAGFLKEAFLSWEKASPDKIKLAFTEDRDEAALVCSWTDDKSEMMHLAEGGNTVLVPDQDGILSVDMKILTLPPPNTQSPSDNYISRVCLHEAGHALGLTGHSPSRDDVMYATVYPGDRASLSERDKNSIVELYSLDDETIAKVRLDQGLAITEIPKEMQNPQINAVRLNNEAARALKANNYEVAMKKLEEAHKLDPRNKLVSANLGGVYANYGSVAGMTFNLKAAAQYYKKAVPLLESGNNKIALIQVLTNYSRVLKMLNREAEFQTVKKKLDSLSK